MSGKFGQKAAPAATTAAPAKSSGGTTNQPKNIQLFDIRTVQTSKGPKQKIQLSKGVSFTVDGVPVNAGEYNSFFLKDNAEHEADLGFFVDKGMMTEEKANEDVQFIEEKGITLRLKVPNPKLQS